MTEPNKINGIINIYKPKGMTSHDAVNRLRRIFNMKKIGHTGTLDPDAEGVLPICAGCATKTADMLTATNKQYRARVTLGSATDTQDSSGQVVKSAEVNVTREQIENTVKNFIGEIDQIPPMYSAIKIGGRKLYELARENKTVERPPRRINISCIEITEFDLENNSFEMLVDCSKGTYIRTLSNDIGEALGCFGHMSGLVRTKSGRFDVLNSYTLSQIEDMFSNGDLTFLIPVDEVFDKYEKLTVNDKASVMVTNGVKVRAPKSAANGNIYRVYDLGGKFLTLSQCEEGRLKILKTFFV